MPKFDRRYKRHSPDPYREPSLSFLPFDAIIPIIGKVSSHMSQHFPPGKNEIMKY